MSKNNKREAVFAELKVPEFIYIYKYKYKLNWIIKFNRIQYYTYRMSIYP